MADRLLVDLAADGRVSVGTWLDGQSPGEEPDESCGQAWPLDGDALEELRWYLEDYLRAPFGVYENRGPVAAARLASWGEAIFGAIFGVGPARDVYTQMRDNGAGLQVVFRSASTKWLALPWELMRDPARGVPLALDAPMDRIGPAGELGSSCEVPGSRLRVLMVISGPADAAQTGFRTIARSLLQRLAAVRGAVDLVVLRPPTLDALAATLAEAASVGEPFQVVHFDGHCAEPGHPASGGADGMRQGAAPEEALVFQGPDGSRDSVPASRVARVLATTRVPVVVLSATQSGAVGKELEAAVATRLLAGGSGSVVAMAYSLDTVAAAEFMTTFYERLFAGDSVSAAVTTGRQQLFRHDRRPSPKGKLPLADWVVPTHYLAREVRFPWLVTTRPAGEPSLEATLNQLRDPGPRPAGTGDVGGARALTGRALAPVGGVFIGRDGLFDELETAARLQRVVVLCGPAGTGKTELAKAFGRWWQDTGGVDKPEWVFWHSFEPGLASFGLDGVIGEIGLRLHGPDFARLGAAERIGVVERFLRDRRALLIWDNFESVHSMPGPSAATPPLDDAGCAQLSGFLRRLAAGGRSAVLVTSRSDEAWLDSGGSPSPPSSPSPPGPKAHPSPAKIRRIRVAGLLPQEAIEYAGELLAPYPAAAPRRADRVFAELMQWLDGHPLSMRLVLPYLNTTDAGALLAELRDTSLPHWRDDAQPGHADSLPASLGYAIAHLDDTARRLLSAVCLFQGTADADVLALVSGADDVPKRFDDASRDAWAGALDAAAGVGLLTRLGGGMYHVHSALAACLTALWSTEESAGYEHQRAAAIRALLSAYAAFGNWLSQQIDSGDAGFAYTVIDLQRRTMGQLLGYALDGQHWDEARAITQPLSHYWDARGWQIEANAWTDRALLAVEDADGMAPALDSPAGNLWLVLTSSLAGRQVTSGHLDLANQTCREVLAMLQDQPASPAQQNRLAVSYHELGRVAQLRGRLDEAADWYTQSLAVLEELGQQPGVATSYHQLGMVAQLRDRLDEAAEWYARSLAIKEELGDRPGMATSSHQLGRIAQDRGRLTEAADWYAWSIAIKEDLGDRPGLATSYHQLGMVAQDRGRLKEAAQWYARSMAIEAELDNRAGLAASYHQLGMVAQLRERLDDAAQWYAQALTVEAELDNGPGLAISYYQLGTVAQLRGRLDEAAGWYAQSLIITEELGDRPMMALSYSQLGLIAEEQRRPGRALEWTVRCVTLFDDVPHPGSGTDPGQLARLARQLGNGALDACWRQVTGGPVPHAVRDYVRSYRPESGDTSA